MPGREGMWWVRCMWLLLIHFAFQPSVLMAENEVREVAVVDNPMTLYMDTLKALKTSEDVDELYLSVAVYPSGENPYHFRIPSFPNYWRSSHLDSIKALKILETALKPNQSVMVVMSLIEHDVPPWNQDDLVGTFRLNLKEKNGQIVYQWKRPNVEEDKSSIQSTQNPLVQSYHLTGNDSEYDLSLRLQLPNAPTATIAQPKDPNATAVHQDDPANKGI